MKNANQSRLEKGVKMIGFALTPMLDEEACYNYLVEALHPTGLYCPQGHPLPPDQAPHRKVRAPVMDYRCRQCGKVFNAFSGTLWSRTKYRPSIIVQILKGIAQGTPTQHLAWELKIDRSTLTTRRQEIQALLAANFPLPPAKAGR